MPSEDGMFLLKKILFPKGERVASDMIGSMAKIKRRKENKMTPALAVL